MSKGIQIQKNLDIKAVMLADSFQTRFYPLTQEQPKTLFPVVNETLIEYSLHWLSMNDIKDIIVLYQTRKEKIVKYFQERAQNRKSKSKQEIRLIDCAEAKSVGDALRELHSQGLIHSDFILFHADTITNIDLQIPLKQYFERREQNKSNIVTSIVYKRHSVTSALSDEEDFYVYTLDTQNQILQLDNLTQKINIRFSNQRIKMDKGQSTNSIIHSDLVDTEIYICSFDLLNAFQENFMHHNIRDDFMKEIIFSEIKEEALHLYETPKNQISIRIRTPRMYYVACMLILQGYFTPFVPDAVFLKQPYKHDDLFRYFGSNCRIHHTAIISNISSIGSDCQIGDGVQIINSIIGQNCIIGNNSIIRNSVLFGDVKIKEGVEIRSSLIAKYVTIDSGCIIERGSIISYNTEIKPGKKIPEYSRVGCLLQIAMSQNEYFFRGCFYESGDPLVSFDAQQTVYLQLQADQSLPGQESSDQNIESQKISQKDKEDFFFEEIKLLVQECKDNPESITQAQISIDTMKLNYNKSLVQCIEAFMPGMLSSLLERTYETTMEQVSSISQKINLYKEFIKKYMHGTDETEAFIQQIEDFCFKNEQFQNSIHIFFQLAYKNELVSGQDILDWEQKNQASIDPLITKFLKLNETFLGWLRQKEQEEEEEEEDEDEEEEEEEEEQGNVDGDEENNCDDQEQLDQ